MFLTKFLKKIVPSAHYASVLEKTLMTRINQLDQKNEYLFWMLQTMMANGDASVRQKVFAQMPLATGYTRKIQLANNFILSRLKDICDANGLRFCLLYGTLLGAVRHKGFIPWDDDIDIGMMREDYEKLKEILKKDDLLVFNYYYSPIRGIVPKVKFRDSDVFFADIYPMDYIEESDFKNLDNWKISEEIQISLQEEIIQEGKNRRIFTQGNGTVEYKDLDSWVEAKLDVLKEKMPFYGHGNAFCFSIENYNVTRSELKSVALESGFPLLEDALEFEGKKYDILKNSFAFLESHYGDIWSFPKTLGTTHTAELAGYSEKEESLLKKLGLTEK